MPSTKYFWAAKKSRISGITDTSAMDMTWFHCILDVTSILTLRASDSGNFETVLM